MNKEEKARELENYLLDKGYHIDQQRQLKSIIDTVLEYANQQLLEEQSKWLMANTSLDVEKIVDFKERFK